MDRLVSTEDTDGNYQITVEDGGPKVHTHGQLHLSSCGQTIERLSVGFGIGHGQQRRI